MALKTVMGVIRPKSVGPIGNYRYANISGISIVNPPPNPLDFICVANTGEIGDGTFYILDAYCRGFGGNTLIPSFIDVGEPIQIHANVESTPVILSSPFLENPNVSPTPIILQGIQEFVII